MPHATQQTAAATTQSGATPHSLSTPLIKLVVPNDLHTIYNFDGVYSKGITGNKQEVVVIEDSDVYSDEGLA